MAKVSSLEERLVASTFMGYYCVHFHFCSPPCISNLHVSSKCGKFRWEIIFLLRARKFKSNLQMSRLNQPAVTSCWFHLWITQVQLLLYSTSIQQYVYFQTCYTFIWKTTLKPTSFTYILTFVSETLNSLTKACNKKLLFCTTVW